MGEETNELKVLGIAFDVEPGELVGDVPDDYEVLSLIVAHHPSRGFSMRDMNTFEAAADMYKALEGLIRDSVLTPPWLNTVKAALAKANGEK